MLQVFFQMIFSIAVVMAACLALLSCGNLKFQGTIMSWDSCCLLISTPALNAFLMFVVQTILVVLAEACFLKNISNSIIISLDIIYFISMMLLVLYHSLKESHDLLWKVA